MAALAQVLILLIAKNLSSLSSKVLNPARHCISNSMLPLMFPMQSTIAAASRSARCPRFKRLETVTEAARADFMEMVMASMLSL
ncbi:hypothetical protein Vadar_025843 [Vaccinium darrowii]|uniref:Uncharacterized protein n=1 Tax=Vaccinium darrowii TaxID=229202 RepID=A0ACB7YQ84_9ERIC|nr:hypothetical protein Vadar_025843 [Vaccinium darrowii]